MQLLVFNELSSTNDYVIELFQNFSDQYSFPIAVLAYEQSAGKGQLVSQKRNVWISKRGNLHLSMLFPFPPYPLASLQAAWLVVRYLKDVLGFSPTLKWPNDILVDGKKIAGILCQGENPSPAPALPHRRTYTCVGIGVNILVDDVASHYPVTCLRTLSGEDYDIESCAQGLVELFAQEFSSEYASMESSYSTLLRAPYSTLLRAPYSTLLRAVTPYFPPLNTLLFARGEEFVRWQGVNEQGHAVVKSDDGKSKGKGKEEVFVSAGSLKTLSQTLSYFVVIEVGNAHIRVILLDIRSLEKVSEKSWIVEEVCQHSEYKNVSMVFAKDFVSDIQAWISSLAKSSSTLPLVASFLSTYPQLSQQLKHHLPSSVKVCEVVKRTLRLRLGSYPLDEFGMDRLCFLEGLLQKHYQNDSQAFFMAISFGTAITVDFCDFAGKYLGGAIFPGEHLSARILHEGTAALPKMDTTTTTTTREMSSRELGADTLTSMKVGILAEKLGALRWLLGQVIERHRLTQREYSGKVFVSGGGAKIYAPFLASELSTAAEQPIDLIDTDLAAEGLWVVMNACDGA